MNKADKYIVTTASSKNVFLVSVILFVVAAIVAIAIGTYILAVIALPLPLLGYLLEATTKNRKTERIIIDRTGIKFTECKRMFLWKNINSIRVEKHLPTGHPRYYIIITTCTHKRYKIYANTYAIDFARFKNAVNELSGRKLMEKKYIEKP